eukprot:scaffold3946_cov118-Isochrysis_galbana.AAC.9
MRRQSLHRSTRRGPCGHRLTPCPQPLRPSGPPQPASPARLAWPPDKRGGGGGCSRTRAAGSSGAHAPLATKAVALHRRRPRAPVSRRNPAAPPPPTRPAEVAQEGKAAPAAVRLAVVVAAAAWPPPAAAAAHLRQIGHARERQGVKPQGVKTAVGGGEPGRAQLLVRSQELMIPHVELEHGAGGLPRGREHAALIPEWGGGVGHVVRLALGPLNAVEEHSLQRGGWDRRSVRPGGRRAEAGGRTTNASAESNPKVMGRF